MIKLKQEVELYKEKFLTAEKFSNLVFSQYLKNKGLTDYIDCIFDVCKNIGIGLDEYEKIRRLITPELKKKIELDCNRKNMLKFKKEIKKLPTFE